MPRKILIGIIRHPKRFLVAVAFGYTTLWTVLEPILSLINVKAEGYNWVYLTGYALISVIIALFVVYPKKKIQFDFKNTNTKVEILFGDLFQVNGQKVIGVSEFFDTKIGKPVSQKSLHGIFIEKILGGHISIFDDAVSSQLKGREIGTVHRTDGKHLKYDIGTTIIIDHAQTRYFLFALAVTDQDCNASCIPSLMLTALDGLWDKVRIEGNGNDINLPLLGSGLSRVGLPPSQLIELILISLLRSVKENDLSSTVRIVLLPETFNKVDLALIRHNWQ